MRRIAFAAAACAAVLLAPAPALAQTSSNEDLIRGWYRDYLGRQVGPELQAWTQLLQRGMSPLDLQATILGSDEFFANQGRDPQTFILETLQSVTWSQPTSADLRRWTDRLTALRGDRFAVAREILLTYSQPGAGGTGGFGTGIGTGGASIGAGTNSTTSAAETAARLVSAAKLLSDTLDFEIAGTLQGRQAILQAQALYDACDQYRRIVAIRTFRVNDATYALQDCQRTFAALQSTLNNPPGTAPSSSNIARRVSSLLSEAQLALRPATSDPAYPANPNYPTNPTYPVPGYPTLPGGNLPTAVGYDQQQFLAAADSIGRAVDSIIQSLTAPNSQNYSARVVLRDLDTFATRVEDMKNSIRRGASAERLQWELEGLSEQARRIKPQLLSGRPPQFTNLFWSSVESSLAQMLEPLGGNTGVVGPGGSTVLRPTPVSPELLPLIDQALSRTEVFLTGTQPLVFGVPELPRVQLDVRNLKTRLLELRQETLDGQPASLLRTTLQSMVASYQAAYNRWGQIVTNYRLLNPPRLSPLGDTLNQVEQVLVRAAASENLTPATGSIGASHVSLLLSTISVELRQFRDLLPTFTSYPEHRALLLYCDQLEDYLATINDAQRNPAGGPEVLRRQAAGMQRVIGLVNANTDSLVARVQANGTRDLRTQSLSLQSKGSRLANLIDDLESELH